MFSWIVDFPSYNMGDLSFHRFLLTFTRPGMPWSALHGGSQNIRGFPMQKITSNYSANRYWVSGWWGLPIPLKNDGVRQLVLWHSQHMESHKKCILTTKQVYDISIFPYWHSQYDGKVIIHSCSSHHQAVLDSIPPNGLSSKKIKRIQEIGNSTNPRKKTQWI